MLLLRQFSSELDDILTQCSSVWCVYTFLADSSYGPYDVIDDVIKFSVSNGHISATDRPIDLVFDPR